MSAGGQRTKWRRNTAENFNRLSRVHERYRQTTDGRTTTYSERSLKMSDNVNIVYRLTISQSCFFMNFANVISINNLLGEKFNNI